MHAALAVTRQDDGRCTLRPELAVEVDPPPVGAVLRAVGGRGGVGAVGGAQLDGVAGELEQTLGGAQEVRQRLRVRQLED